jgi:MYXO-CTERM domain-containing protein
MSSPNQFVARLLLAAGVGTALLTGAVRLHAEGTAPRAETEPPAVARHVTAAKTATGSFGLAGVAVLALLRRRRTSA